MKTHTNQQNPSPDWLDEALNARFGASPGEALSSDFRQCCRAAALGALDVLKMQQHRSEVATLPGSLRDHFQALARIAGVSLENIFCALGVRADASDAASSRGLALLARHLGLARDEAMLRLRWGFAQLAGASLPTEWTTAPVPVRGRQATGTDLNVANMEKMLRPCESDYSPARRSELRSAVNCFAEVFENEMA